MGACGGGWGLDGSGGEMGRRAGAWVVWAVAAGLWAPAAGAEEPEAAEVEQGGGLVGGAEVGVYSAYYYRGEDVFGGAFNVQPTLSVGWAFERAEVGVELWGAFPMHDRRALRAVRDEVDVTVSASVTATERLELWAGLLLAFVPADGTDPYTELEFGADLEIGAGFGVSAEGAVRLERDSGVYFAVGPTWEAELGGPWTLELGAAVGGTRNRGEGLELVELRLEAGLGAALGRGAEASFGLIVARNPSLGATTGSVGFSLGWQR